MILFVFLKDHSDCWLENSLPSVWRWGTSGGRETEQEMLPRVPREGMEARTEAGAVDRGRNRQIQDAVYCQH